MNLEFYAEKTTVRLSEYDIFILDLGLRSLECSKYTQEIQNKLIAAAAEIDKQRRLKDKKRLLDM